VTTQVRLPLLPDAMASWIPLEIPVESTYRGVLDVFGELS
jgi:hypothetical protein